MIDEIDRLDALHQEMMQIKRDTDLAIAQNLELVIRRECGRISAPSQHILETIIESLKGETK